MPEWRHPVPTAPVTCALEAGRGQADGAVLLAGVGERQAGEAQQVQLSVALPLGFGSPTSLSQVGVWQGLLSDPEL